MKIESNMGFTLSTLFNKNTAEQPIAENSAPVSTPAAQTATSAGHTGTLNLLQNNFVQRDSEPSRYIQGALTGFRVENELGNKMQGIIDNYQLQITPEDQSNYAERVLAGEKAARAAGDVLDEEVATKETERLKKEREDSEEEAAKKLEEKAAENSGDTSAGEAAGSSEEAAPSEEASGRQGAEAAVAADATTPRSGNDVGGAASIDLIV